MYVCTYVYVCIYVCGAHVYRCKLYRACKLCCNLTNHDSYDFKQNKEVALTEADHIHEVALSRDDISWVTASSGDPSFDPLFLFRRGLTLSSAASTSSSGRRRWMSTGLSPQFISVALAESWLITKVCICTCMYMYTYI